MTTTTHTNDCVRHEVVRVEEYERLQEALRVIRDSFWSESEPYSERVEHLQQLAREALNEQGKES